MAKKHEIAVAAGGVVGILYVATASLKSGALSGLEIAIPQAMAAITLVLNAFLLRDLTRFEPAQLGELAPSKNTLIGSVFLTCGVAIWYLLKAAITLVSAAH